MDPGRLKRKEEISKALKFIQSSLAFPDPEGYQDFLTGLVCNLLEEGNALFKDRSWVEAVKEFTEGLNVSEYAASEDIHIQEVLLESLYVNRAAAYYSLCEYGRGVEDCDKALSLCKESRRALYRKALCLKELGKYKEAYSCTTDCLLINRMDNQVNELAQDLAIHLGLKIRKPYVGVREDSLLTQVVTNGKTTHEQISMGHTETTTAPLPAISPGSFSSQGQTGVTAEGDSQLPLSSVPEMPDGSELMGDDLDSLLDAFSNVPSEPHLQAFSAPDFMSPSPHSVPSALPDPTPQLPPAFFSSAGSLLNSVSSYLAGGSMASTFDTLDDVSSSANTCAFDAPSSILHGTVASKVSPPMPQNSLEDLDSLDDLLVSNTASVEAPKAKSNSTKPIEQALEIQHESVTNGFNNDTVINAAECLDSLDALDMFPSVENNVATVGAGLDSLSDFNLNGESDFNIALLKTDYKVNKDTNKRFPIKESKGLTSTHQFKQACKTCYPRTGKGIYTFVHKPDLVHSCEKDILLCREKDSVLPWTRVRQRPAGASFSAAYVLCREILQSGDLGVCKYGEDCTFAFNQLEIDVWTEERKGKFDREALFEKPGMKQDPVKGIIKILEEHKGMFIFLCGACFDGKPTKISKCSKDDGTVCSNVDVRHNFEDKKCLVFMVMGDIRYRKVRRLQVLYSLDLCRHSIRYGCQLGDKCKFAHSDVELKTWRLQRETETTPEEMVKVSTNYYEKLKKNLGYKQPQSIKPMNKPKGGKPADRLNMRMRFVCGHCWRVGVTTDPDKTLKYCSAKAKHVWTKDKRILLVKSLERERSKWVMVRSLPHCKHFPLHYDICHRILDHGKCNVGGCTFAHSQEEKDMWTYMKNHRYVDMQQVYDMWLAQIAQSQQKDEPAVSQLPPEEKCIVMPTDYAEPMDGFHCRLCGRHSNSEKQWQKHISSEKHKDRVFSYDEEDKALTWNHRFPAKFFDLCPKLDDNCPDGMSCDYAHSLEELQEWTERRDFLRRKLDIAKEDMLIMPDECDFGKYNFLLQD